MAVSSKYILFSGTNYVDFDLNNSVATLSGQEVQFIGTTGVDVAFLHPGVSLDFTNTGSSADKVYLTGAIADYTMTQVGSKMLLTRGAGLTYESLAIVRGNASQSDTLVFSDGSLSAFGLFPYVANQATIPMPVPTGETSLNPSLPTGVNSIARQVAYSPTVFAPIVAGTKMTIIGSSGVDTVWVQPGGSVDARNLGAGTDKVYVTGAWADYTKTQFGSTWQYSRLVGSNTESIQISNGTSTNSDVIVFADGSVTTFNASRALAINPLAALSSVVQANLSITTPGLNALQTAPSLTLRATSDTGTSSTDRLTADSKPSFDVSGIAGTTVTLFNDTNNDGLLTTARPTPASSPCSRERATPTRPAPRSPSAQPMS